MGHWALSRGGVLTRTAGIITSGDTQLTSVTSGGSSNTQTATPVELPSEGAGGITDIECGGFWLHYWGESSDGVRNAVQLFIGSAGNEVPLTPELLLETGGTTANKFGGSFWVPLGIPVGARISVKHRSSGVSKLMRIGLTLRGMSPFLPEPFGRMTAYGFLGGSTNGTAVTENATPNTKGSAADMTASSTNPCKALILCLYGGGAITVEQHWAYDIMADGIEVVPSIPVFMATGHDRLMGATFGPFEVDLPAGIPLSLRCQSDTGSSPNNTAVLYGLD